MGKNNTETKEVRLYNHTAVDYADYQKYRSFAGLLQTRRGINRFFAILVAFFSLFLFYPIYQEIITASEQGETGKMILFIIVLAPTGMALMLNTLAAFTFRPRSLLYKRVGLFLTCSILSGLFYDQLASDPFIGVLVILLPIASCLGMILPPILTRRQFKTYEGYSYTYQFGEKNFICQIKVPKLGKDDTATMEYKFLAVYELPDVFYLFISPYSAMFVKKSDFSALQQEAFLRIFYRHQIGVKAVQF